MNFIIITPDKDSIQDKDIAHKKDVFNYYLKERLKAKYGVFFYTLGAFYQGWQDILFLERAYKHKGKKKKYTKILCILLES